MSRQRTLEQDRAKAAWDAICDVKGKQYEAKYSTLARKGATDILSNGLGQTLAFWYAKNEKEHQTIIADVSEWVMGQMQIEDQQGLLGWITRVASTEEYRQATSEALAYMVWLKRFAEAELKSGEV